jgi:DNA-binding transcriptional LysR family regulator
MDFPDVEAFVAVVDHAGFTRAASALHLSQPALSRRIGLLEQRLGHPLFERGRRVVRLTDAGHALLPHARAALASLRDGAAAVAEHARGDAGTLTVAIVGTLASTGIAAQLGRHREAHPGVRIVLRTGSSAEVSNLVRRGEAALGLRYGVDPSPDLVARELFRELLVVVAPPSHPLARARRVTAARVRDEPWVAFPARRGALADPFAHALGRALAGAGLDPAQIVVIDSLTAQKRLVEAGFGLALLPASGVEEELARGSLRVLDVPALQSSVGVALIQRKGAFASRAAADLADALAMGPAARAVSSRRRRAQRGGAKR